MSKEKFNEIREAEAASWDSKTDYEKEVAYSSFLSKEIENLKIKLLETERDRDASLNAERAWESLMMELVGEDGPKSVREKLEFLIAKRDAYIDQDKKIREAISADENEATIDEVNRLRRAFRAFVDLAHVMRDAQRIYQEEKSLSNQFNRGKKEKRVDEAIADFRRREVELELPFKFDAADAI